jgi:hypothetical protein
MNTNAAMKERPKDPDQLPGHAQQRPWTSNEVAQLREWATLGAEAIAELMERPVWSIRMQARRQRISLRRHGEKRGRFLGQPNGLSIGSEANRAHFWQVMREDVLAGRVDVARMERRIKLILRGKDPCPACGDRPIENEITGFCLDCHLRTLAEAHAMEQGTAGAERVLNRERQRKHRRGERQPVSASSLLAAITTPSPDEVTDVADDGDGEEEP